MNLEAVVDVLTIIGLFLRLALVVGVIIAIGYTLVCIEGLTAKYRGLMKALRKEMEHVHDFKIYACVVCGTINDGRYAVRSIDDERPWTHHYCGLHQLPYQYTDVEMAHSGVVGTYWALATLPVTLEERESMTFRVHESQWIRRVNEDGTPYNFASWGADISHLGHAAFAAHHDPELAGLLMKDPALAILSAVDKSDLAGKPDVEWLEKAPPSSEGSVRALDAEIIEHPRGTIIVRVVLTGDLGQKKVRPNTRRSLAIRAGNRIINAVDEALGLVEKA